MSVNESTHSPVDYVYTADSDENDFKHSGAGASQRASRRRHSTGTCAETIEQPYFGLPSGDHVDSEGRPCEVKYGRGPYGDSELCRYRPERLGPDAEDD